MREDKINFYMEPVEIEIYFKKAGTVKTIIKELYIELIDELPSFEKGRMIFQHFTDEGTPIDILEAEYFSGYYSTCYGIVFSIHGSL